MDCINCSINICIDDEYVKWLNCQALYCLKYESESKALDLFYVDDEKILYNKKCFKC